MATSGAKETIYLFTTTRISLYKRDLLNVCCFPDGWIVEFGYKSEYVPPALITDPQERLDGHPAIIVFCEPVNQNNIYYRYYPTRIGEIKATHKDLSGCLTISIKLDRIFNYTASDIDTRIDAFQNFVANSPDRPQTLKTERAARKPNIFVRSGTDCFPADHWQSWEKYWYSLAARLCTRKGLEDAFFVRIKPQGRVATAGRGLTFPPAILDGGGRPKWRLSAGKSYELRLEVRAAKSEAPPKVTTRAELLYSLGPFERQSGDGTEVEYLLAPRRSFQLEYSLFEIRVEPEKDGKSRSSEFGGVLEIAPSRWLLFSTLSLLTVGSALISFDSAILEKWFGKSSPSTIWDGITAFWIMKTIGLIMIGAGGYLGFRKLPLKS